MIDNVYKPKEKLYYSDARCTTIYDLPKNKNIESIENIISFSNIEERDAKLIADMESIIYPEKMHSGITDVLDLIEKERELEIPGAAASFIVGKGKEPAGYMTLLPEKSEVNSDEMVAHIYDMAILPKFQGTKVAKDMMHRILSSAAAGYEVSLEFEARSSTSFKLLMNPRIQKWIESKGFSVKVVEKKENYMDNEDFYLIGLENESDDPSALDNIEL